MRLSDDYIQALIAANDIVDVVGQYVELRGRGRYLSGLCPFHNEKTPSFYVYTEPNDQHFHCFGCGKGGSVITFVRDIEGIDFSEAVRMLADRAGMALPEDGFDDSIAKLRRQIYEANREAAKFFHSALYSPGGKKALDYFRERGLTDATIRHFGLGYAPDDWSQLHRHLKSKGFPDNVLLTADLIKQNRNGGYRDAFRNRVMFPIIDVKGSVIAFGGRVLDDSKPKYLNTSDTPVYKKSNGVFALNFAKTKNSGRLILCEGYMDVIAYHQAGFTEAVAGLGTAFTEQQAKLLSSYCEEIILSYDSDEAGQKAADRAIGILSSTKLSVKVAMITGGKDPDEIIKTDGAEKMRRILNDAVPAEQFKLMRATGGVDKATPDGKVKYLHKACEVVAGMRDEISADVYISKLSEETGVTREAIKSQVDKIKRQRRRSSQREAADGAARFSTARGDGLRLRELASSKAEETLLALVFLQPDLYKKYGQPIDPELFVSDENRRLFEIITKRISDGRTLDFPVVAAELDDEDASRLSALISARMNLSNTMKEFSDTVTVMKREYEKRRRQSIDMSTLTDDEFRKLFSNNKRGN